MANKPNTTTTNAKPATGTPGQATGSTAPTTGAALANMATVGGGTTAPSTAPATVAPTPTQVAGYAVLPGYTPTYRQQGNRMVANPAPGTVRMVPWANVPLSVVALQPVKVASAAATPLQLAQLHLLCQPGGATSAQLYGTRPSGKGKGGVPWLDVVANLAKRFGAAPGSLQVVRGAAPTTGGVAYQLHGTLSPAVQAQLGYASPNVPVAAPTPAAATG